MFGQDRWNTAEFGVYSMLFENGCYDNRVHRRHSKCTHSFPNIKTGKVKDDGRDISWSFDDTSEYVPGGPKMPPGRNKVKV